ncbi:DUF4383 domain-containing protein [Streptomyces sp. AGS-58]|uniref:DUF4383 domain-containing protein n=1 Tax=unclassified Streptomyces TaxID=2593676 RepID=UPI0035A2A558
MAAHAVHTRKADERPRMRLDDHLPVDHRLNRVYRLGAGLIGAFLVVFGVLGLINHIGYFNTGGARVVGLNANGSLSVLSICIGAILLAGMVIGGNVASTLNMVLGVLFLLNGFLFLGLLDTRSNFLAFKIQNVFFSFIVGLLLMTFGMYGRVGHALPYDNPYWRARHPDPSPQEQRDGPERQDPRRGQVR